MTDVARHQSKTARKRAGTSAGLLFALATLIVLVVGAAALVALMLWPRWPGAAVAPDAPALPITVGGVLFNVPPAAIRVPVQRHSGATERLDLAFLWPSLQPPDRKSEACANRDHAADRPAVHHHRAAGTRAAAERARAHDLPALPRRNAIRWPGRTEGHPVQGRHARIRTRICSSIRPRSPDLWHAVRGPAPPVRPACASTNAASRVPT